MVQHTSPGAAFAVVEDDLRYVDWPAILAGAVLASALSLVLLAFGAAFGLSLGSPTVAEGTSLRWITIAGGIWFVWTAVTSVSAGGYLAGRLRRRIGDANPDEIEARDGAHGVVVWAVGAVLAGLMAVSGISGTLSAVTGGAEAALEIAEGRLGEGTNYASMELLRGDRGTASAATTSEVAAILAHGFAEGAVSDADRTYVATVVADQTGLDPAAAAERVDAVIADGLAAREAAVAAAEQLRIAGMIAAFGYAAAMLVSAAAAYFAAATGGAHRDANLGFRRFGA